jgi:hypothetical protein
MKTYLIERLGEFALMTAMASVMFIALIPLA